MPYPVSITMTPLLASRNKLTTAFRLVLAIPHLFLVGGIGFSMVFRTGRAEGVTRLGPETGLLGFIAGLLAIVSWFTIMISREHIAGIRGYTKFYMRWRVRGLSYLMLLQDAYPPLGDAPYPASVMIADPGERDLVSVGLRILLAIPHFIVLVFLMTAFWLTTIVAWISILISGRYPGGLYDFGVGALQWLIRVESYVLLLVDQYPPFSME